MLSQGISLKTKSEQIVQNETRLNVILHFQLGLQVGLSKTEPANFSRTQDSAGFSPIIILGKKNSRIFIKKLEKCAS